jgi:integrase/recombinase XerD
MGHESIQTTLRYAKVTSLRDAPRTQKSESAARHALNILINCDQKADL